MPHNTKCYTFKDKFYNKLELKDWSMFRKYPIIRIIIFNKISTFDINEIMKNSNYL